MLGAGVATLSFGAAGDGSGYDAAKRVTQLRWGNAGGAFVDRAYEYNRESALTVERRHDQGGATDRFAYDSADRLERATYASAGPTPEIKEVAYLFDGVGNRSRVTEAGVATVYSANELNQYTLVGEAQSCRGSPWLALTWPLSLALVPRPS